VAKKKKIEDERPDITINVDGTSTWMISQHGPIKGLYTGLFKFRCYLTPLQQIAANREYRELLGQNITMADEHITFVTYCLTQLKQRIIEAPPFWNSTTSGFAGDIEDDNIVAQVLEAAIQSELKYKKVLEQRRIEAVERAKKAAEEALARRQKEKEEEIKKG
jgi:hypothetical protein